MKLPIIATNDFTLVLMPTSHNYFGAATAWAAPSLGMTLEGNTLPFFWPPGAPFGQHKLTISVRYRGWRIVQAGHKLGPLVPHIQIVPAPDDLLTPLQMLMSSWEVKFQNGEVTQEGAPVGTMAPFLCPGVLCADLMSAPIGASVTYLLNDVVHDVSWTDIIAGWVELAVTMLLELANNYAQGNLGGPGPGRAARPSNAEIAQEVLGPLASNPQDMAIGAQRGTVASLAGAAVRAVGRECFGYQGAISVQTGVSVGALGGATLQYTSNRDGSWSTQVEGTSYGGLAADSYQYSENAEGLATRQSTSREGSVSTQNTWTEERGPDGTTRTVHQQRRTDHLRGTSSETPARVVPDASDWL
jgi:hypothetical protein